MIADPQFEKLLIKQLLNLSTTAIKTGTLPDKIDNKTMLSDFNTLLKEFQTIQEPVKNTQTLQQANQLLNTTNQDGLKQTAESLVNLISQQQKVQIDKSTLTTISNKLVEFMSNELNFMQIKPQQPIHTIKDLLPFLLFNYPSLPMESENIYNEPMLGFNYKGTGYLSSCPVDCPFRLTCKNFY